MSLDPLVQTYVVESREMLDDMENILLSIEQDAGPESLNAIFRAAHTIKGSAGLFGLDYIVEFTHGVESLLDNLRDGSMAINDNIISLLFATRDHLSDLMDNLEQGREEPSASQNERSKELSDKIASLGIGQSTASTNVVTADNNLNATEEETEDHCEEVTSDNWHISLRFGENSLREGMDPISFLRYLSTLGTIVNITTLYDTVPEIQGIDPEACYLGFEINFESSAEKQEIENVFEFIRHDSQVRIVPPRSSINSYIELIKALPEEEMRLGDILVRCGSLTPAELEKALRLQDELRTQSVERPLGNIVVEDGMVTQPVVEAAIEKQTQVRSNKINQTQSIRVDAEKLDNLINLIGELVIAGAGTALNAQATGDNVLIESIFTLSSLVEEVRDSALRLRMVQIGDTFNKFKRVVREVSSELGKEIELVITGAETELDKTVVEKIGDPLMHLVRNSMDHGIEPAEVRKANGKPAKGILRLNAYHDSGSIVIEVSDDGAGLNRDKVLTKAIEKGLVQANQQLEDQEINNLIFEPGFSTADAVTNLSGRGVGMDVVKRNIIALRGTVELETAAGKGTTFRVRLPLTLAIIDGFLVGVEKSSFVVPLDMVIECLELNQLNQEASIERDYLNLRGEVLPFIRLRDLFAVGGRAPRRENVVVVQYGGAKAGLVVDQLQGEFQTVIKPMGKIFSNVAGISGSTILGNGEVALIIDVPGLVQQVSTLKNPAVNSAA